MAEIDATVVVGAELGAAGDSYLVLATPPALDDFVHYLWEFGYTGARWERAAARDAVR